MSVFEGNPKIMVLVIDVFILINTVSASLFHLTRKLEDFSLSFFNRLFNGLKIISIFVIYCLQNLTAPRKDWSSFTVWGFG